METIITFETPTIDAQVASLDAKFNPTRVAERFQQTKDILSSALEAGSIYNVDLQDAKESFSRAIEIVLREAFSAFWDKNRSLLDSDDRSQVWDVVETSLMLNHAVSKLRKAEKVVASFPDVAVFASIYREVLPIAQAVETLKTKVVKGRKPLENPKPVDLTNIATCAICQHHQKLTAGKKLVHHGFRISDRNGRYFGFRSGKCFGTIRTPYELSNEANVAFIKVLEESVVSTEKRIASLEAGEVTELNRIETRRERGQKITELKTYRVGDDIFPQLLGHELASANHKLQSLKYEIERQELLVKNWTLKALPA